MKDEEVNDTSKAIVLSYETLVPKEDEIRTLALKHKGLSIKDANDKKGYKLVFQAKNELVRARTDIEKMGKALRKPATDFNKEVIAREKALISLIEPVEKELKATLEAADIEKEKEVRRAALPSRLQTLAELGIKETEELKEKLLTMDEWDFSTMVDTEKKAQLAAREAELKKQEEEIARKNREIEEKERKMAEAEAAAKRKAEEVTPPMTGSQAAPPQNKAENLQKAVDTAMTYKDFLLNHGVTPENVDTEFVLKNDGKVIHLFKKVGEFQVTPK